MSTDAEVAALGEGTGSAAAAPAAAPAVPDSSAAPFDWNAWDGNDAAAPEIHRPALARLRALQDEAFGKERSEWMTEKTSLAAARDKLQSDLDSHKARLAALEIGDDPERQGLERDLTTARAEIEKIRAERDEYHRYIMGSLESQVDAEYQKVAAQHPEVFASDAAAQKVLNLLNAGLTLEQAADTVARLDFGKGIPPKPAVSVTSGNDARPGGRSVVPPGPNPNNNDELRADFLRRLPY